MNQEKATLAPKVTLRDEPGDAVLWRRDAAPDGPRWTVPGVACMHVLFGGGRYRCDAELRQGRR